MGTTGRENILGMKSGLPAADAVGNGSKEGGDDNKDENEITGGTAEKAGSIINLKKKREEENNLKNKRMKASAAVSKHVRVFSSI